MKFVLAALLTLIAMGCTGPDRPHQADLPIFELVYPDRTEQVSLLADHAYLIRWPEGGEPDFYVFDAPRGERFKASDWAAFLERLRNIPDGAEIDRIQKCTVPFAWGMPRSNFEELSRLIRRKSFRVIDWKNSRKHVFLCTCESTERRVLFDER